MSVHNIIKNTQFESTSVFDASLMSFVFSSQVILFSLASSFEA